MSWGTASTWSAAWGKTELTEGEFRAQEMEQMQRAGKVKSAVGIAQGAADLTKLGIQIGELIGQNRYQKQMIREKKASARSSRRHARRQRMRARKDQARASMLSERLNALKAITGARTQKALIAGIGIVVLAGVFLMATKQPRYQPPPPRSSP